ncbi:hypothetical protein ScPMuIL_004540 [Solemya velum]
MILASGIASITLSILLGVAFGNNLTCYTCSTTSESNVCATNVSLAEYELCKPDDNFCTVFRIDTMGLFTSIYRGCEKGCFARCGVWGDEEDEYRCTSCCQSDLCNTDNGSWTIYSQILTVPIVLVRQSSCDGARYRVVERVSLNSK